MNKETFKDAVFKTNNKSFFEIKSLKLRQIMILFGKMAIVKHCIRLQRKLLNIKIQFSVI